MSDTKIHGVPLQTVMTVCERTFVLGKIITRDPTINLLEIMGFKFFHEWYDLCGWRGWRDSTLLHFLRGEDWEVRLTLKIFSPEIDYEQFDYQKWSIPRSVKNVPEHVVRWGRERYFEVVEYDLQGNPETFKSQMLYARMIGADHDDWQGAMNTLN